MRISVDLNKCESYAQCCFFAPEVFELRGREVLLYRTEVGETQRRNVRQSVAACPVQAILIEDGPPDDPADPVTGQPR